MREAFSYKRSGYGLLVIFEKRNRFSFMRNGVFCVLVNCFPILCHPPIAETMICRQWRLMTCGSRILHSGATSSAADRSTFSEFGRPMRGSEFGQPNKRNSEFERPSRSKRSEPRTNKSYQFNQPASREWARNKALHLHKDGFVDRDFATVDDLMHPEAHKPQTSSGKLPSKKQAVSSSEPEDDFLNEPMSEEEKTKRERELATFLETLPEGQRAEAKVVVAEHAIIREFDPAIIEVLTPAHVLDLMPLKTRGARISRMLKAKLVEDNKSHRRKIKRLNRRFEGAIPAGRTADEVTALPGLWNNSMFIRVECNENRDSRLANAWRFQAESPNIIMDFGLLPDPGEAAPLVPVPGQLPEVGEYRAFPIRARAASHQLHTTTLKNRDMKEPFCMTAAFMHPGYRAAYEAYLKMIGMPHPQLLLDIADGDVLDTKWHVGSKTMQPFVILPILHDVRLTGDWRGAFLRNLPSKNYEPVRKSRIGKVAVKAKNRNLSKLF